MSYHRVLPPLPTHSVAPDGLVELDTLLRHKIMTTQSSSVIADRTKSLTFERRSSPVPEKEDPASSGEESVEDPVDSPTIQSRSSSPTTSDRGDRCLEIPSSAVSKPSPFSWQGESPSQICLCQPDPKIPRPRNAFILYRQHHQAAVVAQNPGLANPEISKVVGDRWRHSSEEIKGHWKILAEEEKLRHQKQYPDYRYQPRRSGRNKIGSKPLASTGSGDAEDSRCPKCGGRSITTTPTQIMSDPAAHPSNSPSTSSFFSPNKPPSTPTTGSSAHRFLQNLDSPRLNRPSGARSRPTASSSSNMSALQLTSPRFRRPDSVELPLSPDPKRRRVNGHYPVRAPNGQHTPFPFPPRRRESLPRPDFMPSHRNGPFAMGPPPRPRSNHPDSSLTLPPLQTSSLALNAAAS
ncbi:hypothetical protein MMC29_003357, partial [Sticta canariensis]|nr:hypothetical protein [Sticta canariensis]